MNAVSGDDSDWVRVNGAAVGAGTGPTKDHTTGAMLGKKGFHDITPDPAVNLKAHRGKAHAPLIK